ncbi:hypothetical protein BDN70DRAFT_884887 [Pholiota conissans]|uniref:Uncharacterized protein n=1 Tax=Pholiota conissans TaxID=109636 RepID=A0A9P5YRY5_9AGAR|nr:hypothetical protein BDN70DRAFT_884887 [Pholiota conissans]
MPCDPLLPPPRLPNGYLRSRVGSLSIILSSSAGSSSLSHSQHQMSRIAMKSCSFDLVTLHFIKSFPRPKLQSPHNTMNAKGEGGQRDRRTSITTKTRINASPEIPR